MKIKKENKQKVKIMKENEELKQKLMKYFSLVLKRRAAEEAPKEINPKVLKMLTRKNLIDIIHHRYDGELPPEINLVEMENEGLLKLIGDELFILAYVVRQWCEDLDEREKNKEESPNSSNTSPKKTGNSSSKTKKDGK